MASNVNIRLAIDRINLDELSDNCAAEDPKIFTPGNGVTMQAGFMKGHGTYVEDGQIKASLAGVVEQVNRLVSVKPLKSRYNGEIGDVVVARIVEVQQKRWMVDTNSRLDSILLLSSVNLAGGELRRRGADDEQSMRKYLKEGDIISAEVQNIHDDGALSLYTRSLRYGKLTQGVLVKVFPSLIKRRKTHFHNLPCGASIILGNNGFVWISPPINEVDNADGGYAQNWIQEVTRDDREVIARLRNCILALARCKMMLYDTSVQYAFEESLKYEARELLTQEAIYDVGLMTQHRLRELEEA